MNTQAHVEDINPDDLPSLDFSADLFLGSIKQAMKGASSADLWKIETSDLGRLKVLPGLNLRIKGPELEAHIRNLADLMIAGGYKFSKPIEVVVLNVDGELGAYVTDGHCRLEAVKLALSEGAPIQQISCVTLPSKGVDIKDLVIGIFNSNTGKELTPYERAIGCKRLMNYGMSVQSIAKEVRLTPEYVNVLLEAVSAPLSIASMIQRGEVSLTTAVELLRKHGPDAVEILKSGHEAAKAAGKKKVTPALLPTAVLDKVCKRQAEPLYQAAKAVSADPAFSQLSDENQALIKELLATIAKKEEAAKAKQSAQSNTEDESEGNE